MEIIIVHAKSGKELSSIPNFQPSATIFDVKKAYYKIQPSLYIERQTLRLEPSGKALKDEETLQSLGFRNKGKLYFKDLGPQVGWSTVFLCEYAGPLFVYLAFYLRPGIIYGSAAMQPKAMVVNIAAACWSFHYVKRLLETIFVHRFSHATMPIANLFKNCSYYWGFAGFISYFVNHPLYTSPASGAVQIYGGLALFALGELGNLSTHLAFRNLRPPGTKTRKIPRPTGNPFTILFHLVSCPNYTYEGLSWLGFSLMTQCLPALIFTVVGFCQMSAWALNKHRNYRKEFKDYPRSRKAILPFIL